VVISSLASGNEADAFASERRKSVIRDFGPYQSQASPVRLGLNGRDWKEARGGGLLEMVRLKPDMNLVYGAGGGGWPPWFTCFGSIPANPQFSSLATTDVIQGPLVTIAFFPDEFSPSSTSFNQRAAPGEETVVFLESRVCR